MLRPIKGRPGKFLDTTSGKVLDISDYREDDKYDTEVIPGGVAITAGQFATFFRQTAAKRLIDTNFSQQSRLSAGEEMLIERVGATVRLATGNLLPFPEDVKKVVEDAHLRVLVNNLILIEGPLVKFPSGYGLAGNTVEDGQGIVSIGVPSTAAAMKLLKTQLITAEHEVAGVLTFFDRAWLGTASQINNVAVPVVAANQMPTLRVATLVTVWLHGMLKTAVSK